MSELSGPELSLALCEALGWECEESIPFWHSPTCPGFCDFACNSAGERYGKSGALPNFLDPGVFWPDFEKWCEASGFSASITMSPAHQKYSAVIFLPLAKPKVIALADGQSVTEAGGRAWLNALEGMR